MIPEALGWQCPWCPHQVVTIVGSSRPLAEVAQAQAITEHTDTHLGPEAVPRA